MSPWNVGTADRVYNYCLEHAAELTTPRATVDDDDDRELTDKELGTIADAVGISLADASTTYYDDVVFGLEDGLADV